MDELAVELSRVDPSLFLWQLGQGQSADDVLDALIDFIMRGIGGTPS